MVNKKKWTQYAKDQVENARLAENVGPSQPPLGELVVVIGDSIGAQQGISRSCEEAG